MTLNLLMNNKYGVIILVCNLAVTDVQAAPTKPEKTEIIEVVAQKRKQNIQKVGISVTALPEHRLKALEINDTVEITQQVPGMQLSSFSPNLTIFNLRGVSQNSFTDNLEAPVAVYIDDAYVGSLNAIQGQLFDVKSVEVLRGPQGTLFGRNATGGLVHYLTHLADEDHGNGYIRGAVGSFDRQMVEAAYGNEIVEDLRARVAAKWLKADGYIESAFDDIRAIGGADNISLKTAVQWDLKDNLRLDLLYKYSEDKNVPTGGYAFLPWTQAEIDAGYIPPELMAFTQNVILSGEAPPNGLSLAEFTQLVFFNPDDGFTPVNQAGLTIYTGDHPQPHKHFSNIDGFLQRRIDNLQAKVAWDINPLWQFESVSHFSELDKSYLEDGDGIPAPIISFQTDMNYRQWSQELRFAYSNEQLNWQSGVYWLHMEHDGLATTVGGPVIRLANTLKTDGLIEQDYDPASGSPKAIQDYFIDADNWALFSQVEWLMSANLTAILGLRWSQDDKDLHYVRGFQDLTAGIDLIQQASVTPNSEHGTIDYQDHAAKLQLNWQLSDDQLMFVSYNRGIKVGNWSFSAGVPVNELKHRPETLHAYETGIKSAWPQQGLKLNATAFYYDYQDYQAFSMLGMAPQIRNSDATVKGAEIELDWQLDNALDIILGAAYLDSNVEQVHAIDRWNSPVGGTVIDFPVDTLYDLELPNAPRWSLNYSFNYRLPFFDQSLSLQFDGVYYADQYLEVTNGGGSFQSAYSLSNAKLSYAPANSHWELSLWVKNLFNAVYKQYSLDLGMLGATVYYGPPRTSGLSLAYRF